VIGVDNAWSGVHPVLDYDVEILLVICSTILESLKPATDDESSTPCISPAEQAACIMPLIWCPVSLDPTGWAGHMIICGTSAQLVLITFGDRFPCGPNY